jgi:hypothetical protein
MWDLTVADVRDFALDADQDVVHNCANPLEPPHPNELQDAGMSTSTGGRGGTKIPHEGPPNSCQCSASGRHIRVYGGEGKVQ